VNNEIYDKLNSICQW